MEKNCRPPGLGARSGRSGGFCAFRKISRIVSSGASSVVSTVRSAASSIVEKDEETGNDQVHWAGFDKVEYDEHSSLAVLLLSYRSGFQVWNVEDTNCVRELVSVRDEPVLFLQMLPAVVGPRRSFDRFASSRPLLVICADASRPIRTPNADAMDNTSSRESRDTVHVHDNVDGCFVRFYSLQTMYYVHVLKFRSPVYSLRCSPRTIAVSQSAQIHCFDAATLEREYTILTNPIVPSCTGSGCMGYGPLAVGSRWLAYSGSLVMSNSDQINPENLTKSTTSPNGPVARYAKESGRQLAVGIATLGDIGYKKFSRYYSEQSSSLKANATASGHSHDFDSVGMVIVRDIVSKSVITQFRAHKSPISALRFDPSGLLLVTASIYGHNINVFRIMPSCHGFESGASSETSYVHLYKLQRGLTNAVIQDISISSDSSLIMISSLRGTGHLFAISSSVGPLASYCNNYKVNEMNGLTGSKAYSPASNKKEQNFPKSGIPVTLSPISRVRSEGGGWRSTIGGSDAASGRLSSFSGVIASSFYNYRSHDFSGTSGLKEAKCHLLVFSPSGCIVQYALRAFSNINSMAVSSDQVVAYESMAGYGERVHVEAIQKWNVCQKRNRRDQDANIDIYGENGTTVGKKVFPEESIEEKISLCSNLNGSRSKLGSEGKHHAYLSEAELQMHQARVPLCVKSEFHFESFLTDSVTVDEDQANGEVEIEKLSTHTIEARQKNLIPFAFPQNSENQQESAHCLDVCRRFGLLGEVAVGDDNENFAVYGGHKPPDREASSGLVNISDCPRVEAPSSCVNKADSVGTNKM